VQYSMPAAAVGFSTLLIDVQLVAFATEVLGIAPGRVGALLAIPRIWDAISDPMFGYWSDRARTRFGRRRPFILFGSIPMAAGFFMLWAAPAALATGSLELWTAVALFGFYTGLTLVDMPHAALGAELSRDYHERTRIAGTRRLVIGLGTVLSVLSILLFNQPALTGDIRTAAKLVGGLGALFIVATCSWSVWHCREPRLESDARPASPFRAFGDVLRNPHARRLLVVALFQQGGVAALVSLLPFYSAHVLGTPELTFAYVGVVILASFAGAGLALRLAPSFDKRTLVLAGMTVITGLVASLAFAGRGDVAWTLGIGLMAGLAGGVIDAVGPSLQADVVDYDELETHQRKEGAYFASWTLVAKLSRAGGLLCVSLALQWIGFEPQAEQSAQVQRAIALLIGVLPAGLIAVATWMFVSYGLTRDVHARIASALLARRRVP